ncbi:DHAR1 [Symbiodinium sp. CCMP2592]|nr:DHAR1 [Symbiodinium sp. CCMP2592]
MALRRKRQRAGALLALLTVLAWRPLSFAAPGTNEKAKIEFYTMDMCPYAQRTWITLEEKGVPYTRTLVNVRNATEREWYVKNINPLGKVPSIRDLTDGTVLYESEIINEYLEQKFADSGPALMPPSAAGAAKVRLWNHHLNNKLAPAHFTFLMNKNETAEPDKAKALEEALQYYEDNLKGPFLLGDEFTLADVSALPFFERLIFSCRRFKEYEIPSQMKRLRTWLDKAMSQPSFVATKRPEDKLEEVYQRFLAVNYTSPLVLAAAAAAIGSSRAFCQRCRVLFQPLQRPSGPLPRGASPPNLDLYTAKGVVSAPMPQLPPGKQSVFDGVPLLQTDEVDPGLGALVSQFGSRLVSEFQPLDMVSALLILLGLGLGVLDTRRRWLSYAGDAITWSLYETLGGPTKTLPGRLVPGTQAEVERASMSWPNVRELLAFLQQARVPDRLRAAAAADAAMTQHELRPLAEAVLLACSDALLLDPEMPLPAIDGEWECACDYFRNGNVIFVPMRLRGASGSYTADGGRHEIRDIQRRREGSLVVADFCWENSAGATGNGKWLVSREGNFIAGNWRQDGVAEGPWSWYGRKKPSLRTPPPPEVAKTMAREAANQEPRSTDLGPTAIKAGAAAVEEAGADAAAREAVAQAWDVSAPVQPSGTGGDLAPSAVLRRRWLAAGEDLRAVLGLTVSGLVPEDLQPISAPQRRRRSDAENGGLLRRGATPRDELLKAVRLVLEPAGKGDTMWLITYENVSIVPGKEPRSIW